MSKPMTATQTLIPKDKYIIRSADNENKLIYRNGLKGTKRLKKKKLWNYMSFLGRAIYQYLPIHYLNPTPISPHTQK